MSHGQDINQASVEQRFYAEEDDLIDTLLALLNSDNWENLEMHYEQGNLSAEKTVLRVRSENGSKQELPITLALMAQWSEGDSEVDLCIEITESEYDWTFDECQTACESILDTLKTSFAVSDSTGDFTDSDNGHSGLHDDDDEDDDDWGDDDEAEEHEG